MKVRGLIEGSLRLIGALAEGETPTDQEAQDALSALNDLIESFSTEHLIIPGVLREVFTLTAGQQTYSMGPGGDFDTVRPIEITDALTIVYGSSPLQELPMKIISQNEFADIIVKSVSSTIPLWLYSDGNAPLTNLNVWPVPQVNNQMALYSLKPLSQFASLDDDITLPPGGNRMLRYNLAVEIAPEYGKSDLDPKVISIADHAKANFKRANQKAIYMATDAALRGPRGSFNWITGDTV